MVRNATILKDISIIIDNKVGGLADIAELISDSGANIEAISGYAFPGGQKAEVMLVTDNNAEALKALIAAGYEKIEEREVILLELENNIGSLKHAISKLKGHGVDIKYIYGTTCPGKCPAKVVLSTSNNSRTHLILKA